MTQFEQAMARAIHDVTFREAVLQDTKRALTSYNLSADDESRILQHVELLIAGEEEEVALETSEGMSAGTQLAK
jgi:azurin